MINTLNTIAQVSLPANTVERVLDFIETLWTDLVAVLVVAFLEMLWELFLNIFIDLAPAWGFALVLFGWCYFFYIKFIGDPR